jgi:hypothetical protein
MSRDRRAKRRTLVERLRDSEAEVARLRESSEAEAECLRNELSSAKAALANYQVELGKWVRMAQEKDTTRDELTAARAKVDELQRELSAMNVERTSEKTRANKLARQLEALLNKHIGLSPEGT